MSTETKRSDVMAKRLAKIEALEAEQAPLFPNDFKPSHCVADILRRIATLPEGTAEDPTVCRVAGRMMAVNSFGKSAFIRFRDRTGQLQAYLQQKRLGKEAYGLFGSWTSAILSGCREACLKPARVSGPSWRIGCGCWPRPSGLCPRNSTGSRIRKSAIANAMSI